jgi:hypothetical protein
MQRVNSVAIVKEERMIDDNRNEKLVRSLAKLIDSHDPDGEMLVGGWTQHRGVEIDDAVDGSLMYEIRLALLFEAIWRVKAGESIYSVFRSLSLEPGSDEEPLDKLMLEKLSFEDRQSMLGLELELEEDQEDISMAEVLGVTYDSGGGSSVGRPL